MVVAHVGVEESPNLIPARDTTRTASRNTPARVLITAAVIWGARSLFERRLCAQFLEQRAARCLHRHGAWIAVNISDTVLRA
jgi:hypothetical protein